MFFQRLTGTLSATAVAAVLVAGMASNASAAVINIDPGESHVLMPENTYRTQSEEQTPGAAFFDEYFFSLPDLGPQDGSSEIFYSYDVTFPIPEGAAEDIGIADLTFTVHDETNGTVLNETALTGSDGFAFAGFESGFNFNGVWPAPIDLTLSVSGTALAKGGSYAATLSPVTAIPLPAPVVLFVSALVGLGFLGRRRLKA